MPEPLFLLSAAVAPQPEYLDSKATSHPTKIADPSLRLAQYLSALENWNTLVRGTGGHIVVVETSGEGHVELSAYADVVPFAPTPKQVMAGRGGIEAAAIDHALQTLAPTRQTPLFKVTGRLFVPNALEAARDIDPGTVRARGRADRTFYDSRFIITDVETWQRHLSGMDVQVDDEADRWLERVLAVRLMEADILGGVRVERFPVIPTIVGVSGTTGQVYGSRWEALSGVRYMQRKGEGLLRRMTRRLV